MLTLTTLNNNNPVLPDGIKFPTIADKYKIDIIVYPTSTSTV